MATLEETLSAGLPSTTNQPFSSPALLNEREGERERNAECSPMYNRTSHADPLLQSFTTKPLLFSLLSPLSTPALRTVLTSQKGPTADFPFPKGVKVGDRVRAR